EVERPLDAEEVLIFARRILGDERRLLAARMQRLVVRRREGVAQLRQQRRARLRQLERRRPLVEQRLLIRRGLLHRQARGVVDGQRGREEDQEERVHRAPEFHTPRLNGT